MIVSNYYVNQDALSDHLIDRLIDYYRVRQMSQNRGHHTDLLFIPRVNVSGQPWWWWWWWWCRLGITSDLSTRTRWQSYQQRHLERVGEKDEGMRIFRIQYLWYVNGSFTCREILRHGTSGFTSHPSEERCAADFIALKNPSARSDLNARPLGPVASKLTTIPPRRLSEHLRHYKNFSIIKI
jgi:hypothetical protein